MVPGWDTPELFVNYAENWMVSAISMYFLLRIVQKKFPSAGSFFSLPRGLDQLRLGTRDPVQKSSFSSSMSARI